MSESLLSADELRQAAECFQRASQDSQAMLHQLEQAADRLEGRWAGAAQEMFFRDYRNWQRHSAFLMLLLTDLARELQTLADQFEKADR